ncbi:aminoglycoside N(3)-acetyltransferase [Amphibacillus sp. Q70]|uniref:aminoglycoside N(3)-acetyltransferase n=1 Tax=Amphibacillus sp. Q70 TaxID=3453416 RepID=UPI003F849455
MKRLVDQTEKLNTVETLAKDMRNLGVAEGMTVLVHSSLSSIGWVNGGSVAVIEALMDVVTAKGTLVMPTQSSEWSDPSKWQNPPVPEAWWEEIRATMPPYDRKITPSMGMGKIAEVFRTYPKVERSQHPAVSFAAWGKKKKELLTNHLIDFGLGEESPLAKLYQLDAQILFIGTGYDTNTAFHLGEYRAPGYKVVQEGAPIIRDGERVWRTYQEIDFAEEEFEHIGELFERQHSVKKDQIGLAESRLFSLREAVDFSASYFQRERSD